MVVDTPLRGPTTASTSPALSRSLCPSVLPMAIRPRPLDPSTRQPKRPGGSPTSPSNRCRSLSWPGRDSLHDARPGRPVQPRPRPDTLPSRRRPARPRSTQAVIAGVDTPALRYSCRPGRRNDHRDSRRPAARDIGRTRRAGMFWPPTARHGPRTGDVPGRRLELTAATGVRRPTKGWTVCGSRLWRSTGNLCLPLVGQDGAQAAHRIRARMVGA